MNKDREKLRVYKRRFRGRLRLAILERDEYKCVKCGRGKEDGVSLEIDHIIEWENGGETSFGNGQVLCKSCNIGKYHLKKFDEIGSGETVKKRPENDDLMSPKFNTAVFKL